MSTELKSHQCKQQMTFSDSEINLNTASLFSNVFFSKFFSFIQQTTKSIREHDHNRAKEKQNQRRK